MANRAGDAVNKGIYGALRALLHLIGAVQFWYAIYYDFSFVHLPQDLRGSIKTSNFGGKFKYLTVLNAIIQAAYYTISLINDLIGSNEFNPRNPPAIRKLKDYLLAAFAFPLALNVAITFWGIYAVDRELVFPRALDAIFPNWLNHVVHTNILFFIVLELFVCFRRYPTRKAGLTGLNLFMLAYLIWVHIIYYASGVWVYPILDVLSLPARAAFFAANFVFCTALYFAGEFVNAKIWVRELKPSRGHKMK